MSGLILASCLNSARTDNAIRTLFCSASWLDLLVSIGHLPLSLTLKNVLVLETVYYSTEVHIQEEGTLPAWVKASSFFRSRPLASLQNPPILTLGDHDHRRLLAPSLPFAMLNHCIKESVLNALVTIVLWGLCASSHHRLVNPLGGPCLWKDLGSRNETTRLRSKALRVKRGFKATSVYSFTSLLVVYSVLFPDGFQAQQSPGLPWSPQHPAQGWLH